MKALNNYLVLYDEECPMCRVYTKAFVKTGMLDNEGRAAYQNAPPEVCPIVDMQRAVNEIALVNKETGEVTYGIDSLFKIIGKSFPFFNPLFSFAPFVWLMRKMYAFVSYNRRVIVPADHQSNTFAFQPTFRKDYRIVYLVFTWLITAYILTRYNSLPASFLPPVTWYRWYLIGAGQIMFLAAFAALYTPSKIWDYLGNMMTISFAGVLLLLPVIIAAHWLNISVLFTFFYIITVMVLMLLEHIRRSRLLGLKWTITAGWVAYYLLIIFIFWKLPAENLIL